WRSRATCAWPHPTRASERPWRGRSATSSRRRAWRSSSPRWARSARASSSSRRAWWAPRRRRRSGSWTRFIRPRRSPRGPSASPESRLTLPAGFRIEEFASGFGPTRFMTIDPTGTLLVSTPGRGRVVALPDRNRDGRADTVVTVAEGLELPHGLAFKDGQLYVAETGRVRRFRYDPATLKATDPTVVVPNLPPGGGHWTRTIAFGRDGRLYVSVGSSCNVCTERDPRRAAITRYNADGSGEARFATGLRNAVGLAFHPETGELWATVNERDWRGDDLPPDYITEVKDGAFYGWPDCFAVGGRAVVDRGANGSAERCGRMT